MVKTAHVVCDGCTACCTNDLILLHPKMGDVVEDYLTDEITHPVTGQLAQALERTAEGLCIYQEEKGCRIHGRAPAVCQTFDCRKLFLSMTRLERRQLVKQGICSKAVLKAGRERLHTLR